MSNRFHSKYHRKNHHTYGNATNPEASHDPIASPDQPFLGDFSLQGALCAVAPASAYAGYFYSNNTALCAMAGNRGLYVRGLNPTTSVGIESFSLNIPLSTAYGRNLLHGQVGINKNIITTGYVLDVLGDTNLDGNLNVVKDVQIDGEDLTASTATFNLLNTLPTTTINFGGAATNIEIGSTASTSTVNINGTEQSTNCTTGALVVDGGVGIAKNLNVCGTVALNGTTESTSCTTGTLVVAGGVGIAKNLNVCGNATIAGDLTVDGTWTYLNTEVQVTSAIQVYNTGTGPALKVTQSGTQPIAHFIDSNGDDIVFNDNGYVGIGINTPTEKLTVIGKVSATGFRADQGKPSNVDSSTNGYAFGSDGDTGLFSPINTGGAANGLLSLYSNNVERLRIDNTLVSINSDLSAQDDIYVTDNLYFGGGLQPDTNLYRKSANLLKTDDSFEATKIYSTNTAGNSDQWNSTYTSVSKASADWDYAATNIDGKMPLFTNIPVSKIGDLSYLGLDIKGDFKSPQATDWSKPYIMREKSGKYIGLRGGYNGLYRKQFYFYASTEDLNDLLVTDIEYKPNFLSTTEYVEDIYGANEYGFSVLIRNTVNSNYKVYWININDTLDFSYHTYVDITTIWNTNGLGSLVYCPEASCYIGTKLNPVVFYIFNLDLSLRGSAYTHVNLAFGSSYLTVGTYYGTTQTGNLINHTNRPNVHYYVENNNIYISHLIVNTFFYPNNLFNVGFNAVVVFNLSTNTYSDYYPKVGGKYTIDPDNYQAPNRTYTNTVSLPFFVTTPTADSSVLYFEGMKLRQFYNIDNDIVLEGIKHHYYDLTRFLFKKHNINSGKTWKDVVLAPYKLTDPPTTYGSEKSFYPDDASYLGKMVQLGGWISPNRIFLIANSKSTVESVPSDKQVIAEFTNTTDRRTIYTSNDSLALPNDVFLDTSTVLSPYNNILHFTLESSGNMRCKVLDGLVYKEINGDTLAITNSNVYTLPSDYVTKINNIVIADTNYVTGVTYQWKLWHLKNNLFALGYGYSNATNSKVYCKLLTYNTGTSQFTALTTGAIVDSDTAYTGYTNMTYFSTGSCVIYDNGTDLYCLFSGPQPNRPGLSYQTYFCLKITQSTNTVTGSKHVTSSWMGNNTSYFSIHPSFGPCFMRDSDNISKLFFFYYNNISETNLNTRIVNCFNSILANGLTYASTLYSLTLQAAQGFIIYTSEFPVFIRGSQYKVATGSYNLENIFGTAGVKNKTLYCYVEIIGGIAQLTFYNTRLADNLDMVYIGTVTTGSLGITDSHFDNITKLSNSIKTDNSGRVGINSDIYQDYTLTVGGTIKNDPKAPVTTTTTPYLVSQDDHDKTILANSGSTININLPSGLKAGTQISVIRKGTGTVQFAQGTGSPTIKTTPTASFTKLAFENSAASAYWSGNEWYLVGDLLS